MKNFFLIGLFLENLSNVRISKKHLLIGDSLKFVREGRVDCFLILNICEPYRKSAYQMLMISV